MSDTMSQNATRYTEQTEVGSLAAFMLFVRSVSSNSTAPTAFEKAASWDHYVVQQATQSYRDADVSLRHRGDQRRYWVFSMNPARERVCPASEQVSPGKLYGLRALVRDRAETSRPLVISPRNAIQPYKRVPRYQNPSVLGKVIWVQLFGRRTDITVD
jgi:hypothetical protein